MNSAFGGTEKRGNGKKGRVALALEYGHTIVAKRALNVWEMGRDNLWIELELLSRSEFRTKRAGFYLPKNPGETVWVNTRNILFAYDLK